MSWGFQQYSSNSPTSILYRIQADTVAFKDTFEVWEKKIYVGGNEDEYVRQLLALRIVQLHNQAPDTTMELMNACVEKQLQPHVIETMLLYAPPPVDATKLLAMLHRLPTDVKDMAHEAFVLYVARASVEDDAPPPLPPPPPPPPPPPSTIKIIHAPPTEEDDGRILKMRTADDVTRTPLGCLVTATSNKRGEAAILVLSRSRGSDDASTGAAHAICTTGENTVVTIDANVLSAMYAMHDFHGVTVTMEKLQPLTLLKTLVLHPSTIPDGVLNLDSLPPHLQTLQIVGKDQALNDVVTNPLVATTPCANTLHTLVLRTQKFTAANTFLPQCRALGTLHLQDCGDSVSEEALKNAQKLKKLCLLNAYDSGETIPSMPKLRDMCICGAPLLISVEQQPKLCSLIITEAPRLFVDPDEYALLFPAICGTVAAVVQGISSVVSPGPEPT